MPFIIKLSILSTYFLKSKLNENEYDMDKKDEIINEYKILGLNNYF